MLCTLHYLTAAHLSCVPCAGTVAQRAPGVFLPVCSCVEVLGLSMDKEGTRRLLKQACKAAMVHNTWQVCDGVFFVKGRGLLQVLLLASAV